MAAREEEIASRWMSSWHLSAPDLDVTANIRGGVGIETNGVAKCGWRWNNAETDGQNALAALLEYRPASNTDAVLIKVSEAVLFCSASDQSSQIDRSIDRSSIRRFQSGF
jgi:hypothetical protein